MTTYREFTERMAASHNRIKNAVGEEVFHQQVTARFGLQLSDEAVTGIAQELGWQDSWMGVSRRKAAPAPKSGDVVEMFAPPKSSAPAPIVAVVAPMGPDPATMMSTPPPRIPAASPKTPSPTTAV